MTAQAANGLTHLSMLLPGRGVLFGKASCHAVHQDAAVRAAGRCSNAWSCSSADGLPEVCTVRVSVIHNCCCTHACMLCSAHSPTHSLIHSFIHSLVRSVLPALVIPCVLERVLSSLQLGLLGLRQLMATAQTLRSSTGLWQGSSRLQHALSKAGYGAAARPCCAGQSSCKQSLD